MTLPPLTTILIRPPPLPPVAPNGSNTQPSSSGGLFGINLTYFNLTPQFRGIKLVPPGLHFLHYGHQTPNSPRDGIWIYLNPEVNGDGDRVVKLIWDQTNERYYMEERNENDIHNEDEEKSVWRDYAYMIKFPTTTTTTPTTSWSKLTEGITEEILKEIIPTRHISALTTSARETNTLREALLASARQRSERNGAELADDPILATLDNLAMTTAADDDEVNFMNVVKTGRDAVVEGVMGMELTRQIFDRSWYFLSLLNQNLSKQPEATTQRGVEAQLSDQLSTQLSLEEDKDEGKIQENTSTKSLSPSSSLLIEFRLSFLLVLIFGNPTSLDHYKSLLELFLQSEYILTVPDVLPGVLPDVLSLYTAFIDTFLAQLNSPAPQELWMEIISVDPYLTKQLTHFTRGLFDNGYHSGFDTRLVDKSQNKTVSQLRTKWASEVCPVVKRVLQADLDEAMKGEDSEEDSDDEEFHD